MVDPAPQEALESLAIKLRQSGEHVSIRGTDRARFLYVTRGRRAAEASIDEDGALWIEYWSDTLDEHAPAVKEETFTRIEDAQTSIANWLASPTTGP